MNTTNVTQRIRQATSRSAVERQTAKLPAEVFLWAAGASIIGSLSLRFSGRYNDALFVGQWAPTFLLLGVYSKMAKLFGPDSE